VTTYSGKSELKFHEDYVGLTSCSIRTSERTNVTKMADRFLQILLLAHLKKLFIKLFLECLQNFITAQQKCDFINTSCIPVEPNAVTWVDRRRRVTASVSSTESGMLCLGAQIFILSTCPHFNISSRKSCSFNCKTDERIFKNFLKIVHLKDTLGFGCPYIPQVKMFTSRNPTFTGCNTLLLKKSPLIGPRSMSQSATRRFDKA
jgi:hypothetical protein